MPYGHQDSRSVEAHPLLIRTPAGESSPLMASTPRGRGAATNTQTGSRPRRSVEELIAVHERITKWIEEQEKERETHTGNEILINYYISVSLGIAVTETWMKDS